MTQRSEFQQWKLETKAKLMNWVGNRLFSLKEDGVDGFIKRQMIKPQGKSDN